MPKPQLIALQNIAFGELDFGITVAEVDKQIPFPVKRVYWLHTGAAARQRGGHAHINSEQYIVAVTGDINVHIVNRQGQKENYELKNKGIGLYIPPNHWLNIEMPKHSVLLCLSSHKFEEQETVYDLDQFLTMR